MLPLAPPGARWVDLGSGAGLPGLIVAAADPEARVTLIESDRRKCAFLRACAHAMGVGVEVIEARIEAVLAGTALGDTDIVTARGLAPLSRLLGLAAPLLAAGACGLFPKGRNAAAELTAAEECWRFVVTRFASRTDPDGCIFRISEFAGPRPVPDPSADAC